MGNKARIIAKRRAALITIGGGGYFTYYPSIPDGSVTPCSTPFMEKFKR